MGKNVNHMLYLNRTFENTKKVKVNLTQEQVTKAQMGSRGVALPFL
jgi:hypothetical protein